jgi:hypothetical protein
LQGYKDGNKIGETVGKNGETLFISGIPLLTEKTMRDEDHLGIHRKRP